MSDVRVVHWNPRRNLIAERLPVRRRVNNFGDLIGPMIVESLIEKKVSRVGSRARRHPGRRLLTVGSILHLARDGDTVWGSGARGATASALDYRFSDLDVRAVRGPLTRRFLLERGIEAPPVYGDPALLLPDALPELRDWATMKTRLVTIVPNFADFAATRARYGDLCIDPQSGLLRCLRTIAQSESIVASSLHGIVVAESLGIPARLMVSEHESWFKYEDYYRGTGREPAEPAGSLQQAMRELPTSSPVVRADPALAESFPHDLWSVSRPLLS
jgi:pyruvyltransferase